MNAANEDDQARPGGPVRTACELARPLLVPYLDREASAEEVRLVEAHLSECAICSRELARHRKLSEALVAVGSDGAARKALATKPSLADPLPAGPWLARAVRGKARRSLERRTWVARVAAAALVAGGILWLFHSKPSAPSDDLLTHLEVLEDIEEEGMEPSQDLVQALLETVNFLSEPKVDEMLEEGLGDEVLPDELFPEES
jgi:anti-sigma factor RsiW